jgi:hypothetical protein
MLIFGEPLEYYWWMSVYYFLNSLGTLSFALFSWIVAGIIYRVVAPRTGEGRWRKIARAGPVG